MVNTLINADILITVSSPQRFALTVTRLFMHRRDPKASDEEEYLENLFDVLCSCLMQPFSRTAFFEAEGDTPKLRADPPHSI